jgi:hypothetical protein
VLKDTILKGDHPRIISTKLWWNSHWMVLFQNCVRQLRSPAKMTATVQLYCYWKQLWSRWAITGSWEPLVYELSQFWKGTTQGLFLQSLVEIGSVVSEEKIFFKFHPPPWLKIEISSNGKNCSILSQKVPKFELYKHNDELFNIHYGIFYELWTFAYFDRLCKLEKRGMKF